MRSNIVIAVGSAVLGFAAAAMAYVSVGGGLGRDHLNILLCMLFYELVLIAILTWLVICIETCDPEDRTCTVVCARRAVYAFITATILLIVCIFGHPF